MSTANTTSATQLWSKPLPRAPRQPESLPCSDAHETSTNRFLARVPPISGLPPTSPDKRRGRCQRANGRDGGAVSPRSRIKRRVLESHALPFGQRVVPMVTPVSVQSIVQICRGLTPVTAAGRQGRESIWVLGRREGARAGVCRTVWRLPVR